MCVPLIPDEHIVCSAIYFKDGKKYPHQPQNVDSGFVVTGFRHHNVYATMIAMGQNPEEYKKIPMEEGFITSLYRFVDRKKALRIAIRDKQVTEGHTHSDTELFSEDLY